MRALRNPANGILTTAGADPRMEMFHGDSFHTCEP
jgi:hypothetical protein